MKNFDEMAENYADRVALNPNTYRGDVVTAYVCGCIESSSPDIEEGPSEKDLANASKAALDKCRKIKCTIAHKKASVVSWEPPIKAVTAEEDLIISLLKAARCPNCDGSGTIVTSTTHEGEIDSIEPCEWCHYREKLCTQQVNQTPQFKGEALTAEEILVKHCTRMLAQPNNHFISIEEMKTLPEWKMTLEAMEEYKASSKPVELPTEDKK